jgi:hypothetical protein
MWRVLFPKCLKRTFVSVIGKCEICAQIDQLRKKATEDSDIKIQEKCFDAHLLHRGGMFMVERSHYKARVEHCLKKPDRRLSIIIDSMDQGHSVCPYRGSQKGMTHPLIQGLTAVKEHGYGVTFYRSLNHIGKGGSATIQIILLKLEEWHQRYSYYPEELCIQLDGGPENANSLVLAFLELLVVKRICRKITMTRLPTGHAHEDIDAIFGVIWEHCKNLVLEDLDAWARALEKALEKSGLNVKVVDINYVPSFDFLNDHVDKNLSRLHKGLQTIHQWVFTAIRPNTFFPYGVKTTYRAYAAPQVIYH